MKLLLLTALMLLQACTISGGFGVHDTAFDSHMTEDKLVGWFQGDVKLTENISLYARHESMPRIAERDTLHGGYGINTIGISASSSCLFSCDN